MTSGTDPRLTNCEMTSTPCAFMRVCPGIAGQ